MRKFLEIFGLETKAFVRSKALMMLLVASIGWMLVFPLLAKGDGTAAGARELCIRYSLGGVFLLLVVSLLASATGSLARERAAKRLQLTLIRPVRYAVVVLAKIAAHVAVGAVVLAAACAVLAFKTDLSVPCSHVLSPVLPSPREEARAMYEEYMKDPETPEAVKRTKKEIVLRLLENRAIDHYQVVSTNTTAEWTFPCLPSDDRSVAVRMRFSAQYDTRQDVRGRFDFGPWSAAVTNITQAVVTIPLSPSRPLTLSSSHLLTFANFGSSALMLRPRKDLNVLVEADAFGWNLLRAYAALVAILALVVSFGLFLSAGLGRPVAVFVAFVTLAVSEMSPSVVEQYPDELETNLVDRIGLHITRFAAAATRPVSAASPIEALSKDECVERGAVLRLFLADAFAVPLLLSLLAAFALPRKQDF